MHAEFPAELMEGCSRFVEARAGLHFPKERWPDLGRALEAVAPELGLAGGAELARRLVSKQANGEEIEALVSRLTVGETYFFRDPKAFDALTRLALPELIRARRGTSKRLRIWSAGCCTGEEPYSIAIALSRVLPDLADWEVTILGTDINPRFLRKAEAGVYSRWSFRGTTDEIKARYFRRLPDDRFAILPEIQTLVTFGCVNLAEDAYPSLLTNTNAMDVIFCRNVLMYFSPGQARKVTANLQRALVADGWLFPSGTEASRELFAHFEGAEAPGSIVYRKAPAPFPELAWPRTGGAKMPASHDLGVGPTPLSQSQAESPEAPKHPPRKPAEAAREFANEGRFSEALASCDEALQADKVVPAHHYLRGLILEEQGAHEDAAEALRRALYLDHDFVVAHYALGNLMRRRGRSQDAERCFENARRLLRKFDSAAVLPESDGLTAGRLLSILEASGEDKT